MIDFETMTGIAYICLVLVICAVAVIIFVYQHKEDK